MKKLLNTIYILTPGSYIHVRNQNIVVELDEEEKVSVPAHNIEAIVCFGQNTVSTSLIGFCGEEGISLVFLSENGKFLGRICGPVSGNVLLRKKQYESLNDIEFSARTVRNILYGKIRNAKAVLMRSARNKDSDEKRSVLVAAADKLSDIAKKLQNVNDIDSMRGLEGANREHRQSANISAGGFGGDSHHRPHNIREHVEKQERLVPQSVDMDKGG